MRAATRYLFYRGMTPRMLGDPEAVLRRARRLEEQLARDQKVLDYLISRYVELVRRPAVRRVPQRRYLPGPLGDVRGREHQGRDPQARG